MTEKRPRRRKAREWWVVVKRGSTVYYGCFQSRRYARDFTTQTDVWGNTEIIQVREILPKKVKRGK